VGVAVFFLLASLKPAPAARAPAEKIYNVEVFDVERADLQEIVSSFGTTLASREVVIAAQVKGVIVEMHPRLDVGEKVAASQEQMDDTGQSQHVTGDLLVRIDPKTYREHVEQAKRKLAEDEAELERIKREESNNERLIAKVTADFETMTEEYDRMKQLRKSNSVSASQLARAVLELNQYETTLISRQNDAALFPVREAQVEKRRETHQSDLTIAQLDLDRTVVRPPFTGILSEVMVEQGQYVRAGDPLIRLTDISAVEVPVPLPLDDYAKIASLVESGAQPVVELAKNETDPARWFGNVVRIAPEADELTRTVEVYVEIENTTQTVPLLPGTFVHARIVGPVLEDVLVVPRDAMLNGRLYVAKEGCATQRTARIRRTLQSLAVVEAGVEATEAVILTNLDIIHEGARLRVQSHRSLSDELKGRRVQAARRSLAGSSGKKTDTVN
jgi:RND family efflux transporter MFP subunit